MPSLKPIRLRGVLPRRAGPGSRSASSAARRCRGRSASGCEGVVGDLRIVGTHLQAEVAVRMAGVERVAGEVRERRQLRRPQDVRPAGRRTRPNPNVTVSRAAAGRRPRRCRSAASTVALDRAQRRPPAVSRAAAVLQRCSAGHVVGAAPLVGRKRRSEVGLLRGGDPRLMGAVERRPCLYRRRGRRWSRRAARGGRAGRAAGERQQPAARHPAGTRAHCSDGRRHLR